MTFLLALLLATTQPAAKKTDWMRLDSFHLAIGMSRADALSALHAWSPKPGKTAGEVIVDYTHDKSMTLEFRKDRLQSVRFELFVFLPEVRQVFEEQRAYLLDAIGEPRKVAKSVLIYDGTLPNVIVVANDDPASEQGKKGLGVLAVRYYDPRT